MAPIPERTPTKPARRKPFLAREFFAGCVAGCTASVVGQPLDTIRIRVQTRPVNWFAGARDALAKTLRKEGPLSLFRGAVPPLIGMGPKNAVGFATHGLALRSLEDMGIGGGQDNASGDQEDSALRWRRAAGLDRVMLAGAVAGLAQCAVVVPSDRIKIQLQVQGSAMRRQHHRSGAGSASGDMSLGALRHCVSTLVRAEGVRLAFFRGWWPTVCRQAPAAAVYFSSFETLKRALGGGAAATALAGGCAGCAGYLCTYPLDVLKSAAMAAPPGTPPAEVSMAAVARRLRAEHGGSFRWLARGLGPTLARGFVINAVNFVAFEWVLENVL